MDAVIDVIAVIAVTDREKRKEEKDPVTKHPI